MAEHPTHERSNVILDPDMTLITVQVPAPQATAGRTMPDATGLVQMTVTLRDLARTMSNAPEYRP